MSKIFLFLFLFSSFAYGQSVEQRRQGILKIIDQELDEVRRLSSQSQNNNPDYLLRTAELYLEKARLYREKENEEFLSLDENRRKQVNKKSFFKTSDSFFQAANSACLQITRRFKNYRNIGDVYYILAYNAKEAGNDREAQRYFGLATKNSKRGTQTEVKSKISLAEIYYNQKKYAQAIPLYESALKAHQDRWYTKDSLNLAWSYFRTNRYPQAISKMLEVYEKSQDNKFVDMRGQVERDIGLFYASAGRIDEGMRFYQRLGRNFSDELIVIAMKLKDEGQYTRATQILDQALKNENKDERKAKIYAEQLELFDKFSKYDSHLIAAKNLNELVRKRKVEEYERKRLEYHAGKYAAVLQKQVASPTYKKVRSTLQLKANQSIAYFEILKELQPQKMDEYLLMQGETSFAAGLMTEALGFYDNSYASAVKNNNKQIQERALEGKLAVLGSRTTPQRVKEDNYARTYEAYLATYPVSKRSYDIYQRLFNVYDSKNDTVNANKTLERFAKAYPQDFKVQEAMLAKLMEKSRKNKNYDEIRNYINDINAKKYVVSQKFANRLRELLTTIQIEDVQNSLNKGDKKVALVGYHKILDDPHSTASAKTNAKYNLSALYYELGATKEAYEWSVSAIQDMSVQDVTKFSDSFLAISSFLFGKTQFQASADLSLRILAKLCNSNTAKRNIAFKNSVYLYLAEHDIEKTQTAINLAQKCKVPNSEIVEAKLELLKDFKAKNRIQDYEKLAAELERTPAAFSEIIVAFDDLEAIHKTYGNTQSETNYRNKKMRIYANAVRQKVRLSLEALDVVAKEQLKNLYAIERRIKASGLSFPENVFNNQVKAKLALVEQLTQEASRIQKLGSGLGIVESYRVLAANYRDVANEIDNFTPPDKGPEYIKSFKGALSQVSGPLRNQSNKFSQEGVASIENNEILRDENHGLYEVASNRLAPRYWYYQNAVLMDRGGRQ